MSLGKAIAEYRKKHGWNQAEFAKLLDVHPSYVTRWETGRVQPRTKTLDKIANVLEVTVQELLVGGTDSLAETLNIDDSELMELIRQVPRLEPQQKSALKTILQDMLTRSQFEQLLQR